MSIASCVEAGWNEELDSRWEILEAGSKSELFLGIDHGGIDIKISCLTCAFVVIYSSHL
jgi:hypothetical protein